jgi:hypothetical protein
MSESQAVQHEASNGTPSIKQEPTPAVSSDDNAEAHAEPVEETITKDIAAPDQDAPPSAPPIKEQENQEEITEVISPHGDMHFVVTLNNGNHFGTFLVNSNCIRTASRTWASLLDALPSNPSSTRLVCRTLQGRGLPTRLPFKELVHVAELCKRHDLLELFHPYIRDWAYPWLSKVLKPGYEMWILVAYEVGYYDIFENMS